MKAILFDLDGTLIDSADDIALALEKTLRDLNMTDRIPSDVRKLVGGGARALLEKVLGEDFREEHVEIFRKHYLSNPVVYTKPYEGIPEVLKDLKSRGLKLAVVTNKLNDVTMEILKKLNLKEFFDFVAGGDTFEEKKPSPLPVVKTLSYLKVEPSLSLIVGDTQADIDAGRGAGTKTALALWGYVKLNGAEPDFKLSKPEDILRLIEHS